MESVCLYKGSREQSGFNIDWELALYMVNNLLDSLYILDQQIDILIQKLEHVLDFGFDVIRYVSQIYGLWCYFFVVQEVFYLIRKETIVLGVLSLQKHMGLTTVAWWMILAERGVEYLFQVDFVELSEHQSRMVFWWFLWHGTRLVYLFPWGEWGDQLGLYRCDSSQCLLRQWSMVNHCLEVGFWKRGYHGFTRISLGGDRTNVWSL